MNNINNYIEYASKMIPTFKEFLVGASNAEIERLDDLVKNTFDTHLPQIYKEFLSFMGKSEFVFEMDLTHEINEIYEFYYENYYVEKEKNIETFSSFKDVFLFLVPTSHYDCTLALQEFNNEYRVVELDYTKTGKVVSSSFYKYLYQNLFYHYNCGYYDYYCRKIYSLNNNKFNSVKEILSKYSYISEWYSDSYIFCGEKKGSKMYLTESHLILFQEKEYCDQNELEEELYSKGIKLSIKSYK